MFPRPIPSYTFASFREMETVSNNHRERTNVTIRKYCSHDDDGQWTTPTQHSCRPPSDRSVFDRYDDGYRICIECKNRPSTVAQPWLFTRREETGGGRRRGRGGPARGKGGGTADAGAFVSVGLYFGRRDRQDPLTQARVIGCAHG